MSILWVLESGMDLNLSLLRLKAEWSKVLMLMVPTRYVLLSVFRDSSEVFVFGIFNIAFFSL